MVPLQADSLGGWGRHGLVGLSLGKPRQLGCWPVPGVRRCTDCPGDGCPGKERPGEEIPGEKISTFVVLATKLL